ncbi:MAG: LPXTG cell wall anchor domain-containing protein [Hornefia sp.]|nr:LPXTG cell wall anchor domain-containing protein [Hornefia sp.]
MKVNSDVSGEIVKNSAQVGIDGNYYRTNVTENPTPLYKLPNSGGIGTYLFNIIGSMILTIAVIMYLHSRNYTKI